MKVEHARQAVDQLIAQNIGVHRVTISGGEPCMNSDLPGILQEFARLKTTVRILTVGDPRTKSLRDSIALPNSKFKWVESPVDVPSDRASGKNSRSHESRKRFHRPYWISPADIGLEATYDKCANHGWCGRGLDNNGFTICGQAGILGPLLGIDPYLPLSANGSGSDIARHTTTAIPKMCKHCPYGLTKAERGRMYSAFDRGDLPAVSETFVKAFKAFNVVQVT